MLRLSLPHLDEAAIDAAVRVLRSGQLVHGVNGQAFEEELQAWIGCRHAVLVSSGTAALHLALLALDIGKGDAVLVPDFTFPATANVVRLVGATPVFVDVDPASYCASAAMFDAAIASWRGPERLRALMPVHEFGHPVDMDGVLAIARRHGLSVVEDAACALGARVSGRSAGTLGDIGCFSLHPRKTLTCGEGGIIVTDDAQIARRLRRLRNHGMERGADGPLFHETGLNYRLTDFQAALGRAQLPHLHGWVAARCALASSYCEQLRPLADSGRMALPGEAAGHSWQTFMVVLADGLVRADVIAQLAVQGVEANLGAHCVSVQPAFAAHAPRRGNVQALRLYRQGLALPFCEQYGSDEAERVAAALSSALNGA